jgi:hypothetical protein
VRGNEGGEGEGGREERLEDDWKVVGWFDTRDENELFFW